MPYRASRSQHGRAILRALAYCLARDLGGVMYEQVEGTIHGVPHRRVRFVFEVENGPMRRSATMFRERPGLPDDLRRAPGSDPPSSASGAAPHDQPTTLQFRPEVTDV